MKNRRSFLKKMALGSAAVSLLSMPKKAEAKNEILQNVLLHHVYFWLKNPDSAQDRKQIEQAIAKLLKVETIGKSHFGVPASTENRDVIDHTYTYSLLLIFATKADQDIYQVHPLHQKFVAENSHLWNKVIVYDSVDVSIE